MNVPETSYLHNLHAYERSPVHCDVTVILSNTGTASVYCLSTENLSGVLIVYYHMLALLEISLRAEQQTTLCTPRLKIKVTVGYL